MYVLARNTQGRPMLMHKMAKEPYETHTACGVELHTKSRSYHVKPFPAILCKRCAQIDEG